MSRSRLAAVMFDADKGAGLSASLSTLLDAVAGLQGCSHSLAMRGRIYLGSFELAATVMMPLLHSRRLLQVD